MRITNRIRRRVPKSVVVGTACAAALAAWAGASAIDTTNPASAGDDNGARGRPARNVVLFIGDGMGAAHRTFFREALKGHTGELAMDALPVAGVQHTDSEDPKAPITDSAAAGTAIATGVKTFNGAVGVDSDGRRVRSVLEAARDRGRATGLVTTSQVTDATPASFAAHTSDRGRQSEIARQYSRPATRALRVERRRARGSRSAKLLGLFASEEMFQARPEGQGDEYHHAYRWRT